MFTSKVEQIKQKISRGELVLGSHIGFSCTSFTEIYGDVGYDFVWIDAEHSALDKRDIQEHLIAARAGGAAGFVRIPWNDPVLAKPVLDMGADGIIFPMISSYDDAVKAVRSCQYPPAGIRGFGLRRANHYGILDSSDYVDNYEKNTWKILQVELVGVVKDLPRIVEMEDFDAIVIGPNDFKCSLLGAGIDVSEAEKYFDKISAIVKGSNKALGVSCAYSEDVVKRWVARGVDYMSLGFDFQYVVQGSKHVYQEAHRLYEGKKDR